jgi:hypothetical protein
MYRRDLQAQHERNLEAVTFGVISPALPCSFGADP